MPAIMMIADAAAPTANAVRLKRGCANSLRMTEFYQHISIGVKD